MNIRTILKKSTIELKKAGIATPEIDARALLEHALEKDSVFLYAHPSRPLTNLEYGRFRRSINKRKKRIPVAYITGHKEFFGYDFLVTPATLIPRPESEFLVEYALNHIKSHVPLPKCYVLDMGTGSGCLILSIIKELEKSINFQLLTFNFYASDISPKALSVAKKNAKKLSVSNVRFFQSDLFSNKRLHKKFDLIVTNLPYVPLEKIKNQKSHSSLSLRAHPSESKTKIKINEIYFEPMNAIFARENGAEIIKKFLSQAIKYLSDNGSIIIELDPRNAEQIKKYAQSIFANKNIKLKKDLSGKYRYLIID